MRNGIADRFEMRGIVTSLNKIIKLKKQYNFDDNVIPVTSNISIEFSSLFKTCYICVNGNKAIKYIYGKMRALISDINSKSTYGLLKSCIQFVTTDKTIVNPEFIKEITTILNDSLGEIESNIKNASKARWGLE